MASINANGARGNHKFTLAVAETATNTANNTSTVSFSFVLSPVVAGWDWRSWGNYISYVVTINGTQYTGTIPNYDGASSVTLKSGTQTVAHNSDGTKTLSYSFAVTDKAGKSYTCGNASKDGTLDLTTLPRKAVLLSAPDFDNETDTLTITYSNPAGDAVKSLQACIADKTGKVIYVPYRDIPTTGSSYTFELTESEQAALLNAAGNNNTATMQFFVRTVLTTSEYSTLLRTFSIVNADPVVEGLVIDSNETTFALTGNRNMLVKFFSTAEASFTRAVGQLGATLDESSFTIVNSSNVGHGESCTFEKVESNVFTFSATDSRGNVGAAPVKPDMIEYVKLSCNLGNDKPDANGVVSVKVSGLYFNGSFGEQENTLEVFVRYKEVGGTYGDWISVPADPSENSYLATGELELPDYQKTYVLQAKAVDKLITAYSGEYTIKATPVFDWGENDFNVNGTFKMNGTTMADFIVEQGVSGYWTYRKWNSGVAECWGRISSTPADVDSGNNVAVTLPFSFASTDYVVQITNARNGKLVSYQSDSDASGNVKHSEDSFTLYYAYNYSGIYSVTFNLYVIGKWK